MKKKEVRSSSKSGENSFGVAAVVLGVVSIVFSIFNSVAAVLFGIIGLVFASKQHSSHPTPWAKWGRVTNAIGIILGIVFTIVAIWLYAKNPSLQQVALYG